MMEPKGWWHKEVESLRQQLAALNDELEVAKNVANGNVEAKFDAWRELGECDKQLSDSQKREAMLRDALSWFQGINRYSLAFKGLQAKARDVLAATEPKT